MSETCLICGRDEDEHHDFQPRSVVPGCQCDAESWQGVNSVPGMCKRFVASEWDGERCATCEHDRACHGPAHTERP